MRLIPQWAWKLIPHEHSHFVPGGFILPGESRMVELRACSRCGHEALSCPKEVKALIVAWISRKRAGHLLAELGSLSDEEKFMVINADEQRCRKLLGLP